MLRIIIPAYNEEDNIEDCVSNIAESVSGRDYFIYIVDDGSSDKTHKIVANLSKRMPIEVIRHHKNRGIGAVLTSGISRVVKEGKEGDVIVVVEGDSTSDASLLPLMFEKIKEGCDLVIASRFQKGGGYRRFPLKRLLFSKGANFIFRMLFPIKGVSDYTIFYRAYRFGVLAKAVLANNSFLQTKNFVANAELLFKIRPYVKRVEEIPLAYDYGIKKGKSSLSFKKNITEYIKFIASELYKKFLF